MTKPDLLAHHQGDAVAVAVHELAGGTNTVVYLDGSPEASVEVVQKVPLGHKVALQDLAEGEQVIEYSTVIGRTTTKIRAGEHVHVHNIKGGRWV